VRVCACVYGGLLLVASSGVTQRGSLTLLPLLPQLSASAPFWEYTSTLQRAMDDRTAAYEAQLKRLRVCRADGRWLEEESRLAESVRAADGLVSAYAALDAEQRVAHKFTCHSLLENMYAKAAARLISSPSLLPLKAVLDRLAA
jgi:hypothetical protein